MAKNNKIRVRIAPAPTGTLHIGTARTALFNFLFAKKNKGSFIVRIEDTDKQRSKKEYEKDILDSFEWLGLKWDELYKQSQRTKIYEKYLKKLLDSGKAYKKEIIWFKTPKKKIIFYDLIRGKIEVDGSEIEDFSIAKDLKNPLYNFAAVVDDYEMKISHVIRGEDHIPNTPKQILIYEALGLKPPQFAHLPLILGPDRSKLSKRHGAVAVSDYRKQGYLPEALINFMALLGWNPGDDREFFSLKDLTKEFSLEKIQKGGAVFNIIKLDWFNGYYIRKIPREKLIKLCLPYLPKKTPFEKNKLGKIISLEQGRMKKLSEVGELSDFFFKEPKYKGSLLKWKNMTKKEIINSLNKLEEILSKSRIGETKKILLKAENRGELLWPLRVALSGKKASPDPFEIAEILGKKKTLKRIKKAKSLVK